MNFIEKLKRGEKVFIVCVGDSITQQNKHCHGVLNYVGKLGAYLLDKYGNCFSILNAGIGGDNIVQILNRFERDVLRFKPDLVILMIGMNDAVNGPGGIEDFKRDLRKAINKIIDIGSEILLMTQNPLDLNVEDNRIRRNAYPKYVEAVREVARDKNIPLCDIYKQWEKYIQSNPKLYWPYMNDHIHPNEHGHDFIVSTLIEFLGI